MSSAFIENLRSCGEVVDVSAADFKDVAHVFNQASQHTPLCVVRCRDAAQVARAVRIVADAGHRISVRSGGHSIGGASVAGGAVVLDLRPMSTLSLDEATHDVIAGGGVKLGDLNEFLWARERCTPTGFEPRVGLSGLLLGGGYGLLSRRDGLACDALVEAEVVLADGSVVITDATREPELFWGLRGGGAGLGVVTRFRLRTKPLPGVMVGVATFSIADAPRVLRSYCDRLPELSRDLTLYAAFAWNGDEPTFNVMGYQLDAGPQSRRELSDALALGPAKTRSVTWSTFPELHPSGETGAFPENHRHAWRALFFADLEALCESAGEYAPQHRPGFWTVLEHMGGAISDVKPEDSAFPHRAAHVGWVTALNWKDARPDASLALQERLHETMRPRAMGSYTNYVQAEHGPAGVVDAFGANLPRLRALKARVDPGALFVSPLLEVA